MSDSPAEPLYPNLEVSVKAKFSDESKKLSPVVLAVGVPFIVASPLLLLAFQPEMVMANIMHLSRFTRFFLKNDLNQPYWLGAGGRPLIHSWLKLAFKSTLVMSCTSAIVVKAATMDDPLFFITAPVGVALTKASNLFSSLRDKSAKSDGKFFENTYLIVSSLILAKLMFTK